MEAGQGFLWLPVAFGIGILGYFALRQEPSLAALGLLTGGLIVAAWRMRLRIVAFRVLAVATAVAAGLTAAKVRTDAVAAPVLPREMTARVNGWIAGIQEAAKGGVRVIVRVHDIEDVEAADTPATARITIRSKTDTLAVGEPINVLAGLTPPSGPVIPGSYDFGRTAFYQRIGAYGFAYGAAALADLGPAPLGVRLGEPLARLREAIAGGSRQRCLATPATSRWHSPSAKPAASPSTPRTRCAPPASATSWRSPASTWRLSPGRRSG